eukprot:SAG22_NODE_770_length_7336_cov_56.193589_4_plen_88_part_00
MAVPAQVAAIRFDGATGAMMLVGQVSARGTSTCYLTIDKAAEHMLLVNYWDSTLGTVPLDQNGEGGRGREGGESRPWHPGVGKQESI